MVTREPEWDDIGRARAEAAVYIDDTTCSGCGGDLHHTFEPGHVWFVDNETICYSCQALDLIRRDDAAKHGEDKIITGRHAWGDGRIYSVRPADPELEA